MASNKKGSALLIVIGFLSFMVVSAVAFSIYMRAERMPSSALRRTVTTRQLAKAALAEAMSRIDDAVRGDPFPGLVDRDHCYQPRGYPENNWEGGRVFMPPNPDVREETERYYAPAPMTVSVLTLEGLGYVPPPLVNDARFLGRSTWTASWQNFSYDAGRFAFVALNVSDFFDINRIYANKARTSNADGRISVSYLLDQGFNPLIEQSGGVKSSSVDKFTAGTVKQFDNLVHEGREPGEIGNGAPFVSVLDYQLALKNGISGVMPSLFYNWINNSQPGGVYYTIGDNNIKYAGRQPFVTDSVATNEAYEVDISYYKNPAGQKLLGQPFDKEVTQDASNFMTVNAKAANSQFLTRLNKMPGNVRFGNSSLPALSMYSAILFDYLDHNDVPLSLAWPCVERVPSMVAIEPEFKINVPAIAPEGGEEKKDWYFDANQWLQPGMLNTVWTFPFKRNEQDRNDTFRAQAIIRVFLAPEGLTLRAAEGLGAALRPRNKNDWTAKGEMFNVNDLKNVFCLTFVPQEQQINLKSSVINDDDAGGEARFRITPDTLGNLQRVSLVTEVTEKDPTTKNEVKKYTVNVSPLGLDGRPMFQVGQPLDKPGFDAIASQQKLKPYVAVWVRILNGDDMTVDLVPAVVEDDMAFNGGNSQLPALAQYLVKGADGPLLRFVGNQQFTFSSLFGISGAAAGAGLVEWTPKTFCALDPRFNWAPEDWYTSQDEIISFQQWLERTNNYLESDPADRNGCDHDIFLAVSNMGFLQSLGEFAFLPRVTDLHNGGTPLLAVSGASRGYDGVERNKPEDIANYRCAWTGYEMDFEVYSAMEKVGIGRSTSRECLVNPYSPNWEITMAALANSPCDYWAAAVALDKENKLKETLGDQELPEVDDAVKGLQLAFCESSKGGQSKFRYQDLEKIAKRLNAVLTTPSLITKGKDNVDSRLASDAWKWIWDEELNWWQERNGNGREYNFLGETLEEPLYDIDRKFLYSYWRDCFANQQQLFLIFVRAESSAIGGPGEGTPAQKGARAVALVWRNPAATVDTSTGSNGANDDNNFGNNVKGDRRPHQMRVLFYHQFD